MAQHMDSRQLTHEMPSGCGVIREQLGLRIVWNQRTNVLEGDVVVEELRTQ